MAFPNDGHQLSLPFATTMSRIPDATVDLPPPSNITRGGRPTGNASPLAIELTDTQLLTRLLGASTSLVWRLILANAFALTGRSPGRGTAPD